MEKINFINNSTPAVNATNLNKLQDNVEDAIDELETAQNDKIKTQTTSSDTDTYCCNYVNNMIEEPSYCVATISNAQTISSLYKVVLDSIRDSAGNFTLSNGGIRVGAGINHVRISGGVFVDNWVGGQAYLWGIIKKNDTNIAGSIVSGTASFISSNIANTIISTTEGDIFYLIADSGSGGSLRKSATNTWLCVEKID